MAVGVRYIDLSEALLYLIERLRPQVLGIMLDD